MKRSLALGALMVFVITGSVWAESTIKLNGTDVPLGKNSVVSVGSGNLVINGATISGITPNGNSIINNGGNTTISDTTFVSNNASGKYNGKNRYGLVYNYGSLYLTDVTFERSSGNYINNTANGTVMINGTENYFKDHTSRGIYNYGELIFEVGSETIFTPGYNGRDITNRNGGSITIKEGATVTLEGVGIDLDEGTSGEVNLLGTVNGNIGGNNIVKFGSSGVLNGSMVEGFNAKKTVSTGFCEVEFNGGTWNLTGESKIAVLGGSDGKIAFREKGHLDVDKIDESSNTVTITMVGKDADDLNTKAQLTTVAERMGVAANYKETDKVKVVMAKGDVVGETTGDVVFETKGTGKDTYYHGVVKNVFEAPNPANEAISDTAIGMKLHWRAHVDDMNKRMGELRDANGEHGIWTRMVRGESEYKNTKAQYNQYQLGYDEKLSVDKRWTVGAAVTFSEGDASYGYGSTEDKSTAFAIYGSKLNNDGTFVDLIARYAHLESDVDDQAGTGSYSANGMSVSAEFGKRIQQGNGLWIEPQAELTYGTIDSAEYKLGTKTVEVGDMDSLIGRIGFRIGKDIEKGNVYARASYLYDFEGETENAFRNDTARRSFNEDLGGGWWEVGVGANINLSKATYVYADVEKTFGGEVDTNWQWNLGVRYSF